MRRQMTDQRVDEDFEQITDRYRRELLAHCYRMLGSAHDAEDLVQETFLRAWRSYDGFEHRSSLRTWLYRIATNACLDALQGRSRRPLPTGLGDPGADPAAPLTEQPEVPWLEPMPDAMIGVGASDDPATVVTSRESVRLAFVAVLQHLPPRQRAVLVLREVLTLPAAEVAQVLDTSTASVNSSLQRARANLGLARLTADDVVEPTEPGQRELLDRYAQALEVKDIPALVKMFAADAVWEMPPFSTWFRGPEHIGLLVDRQCPVGPGDLRLWPVRANGQPAFAVYVRGDGGGWEAFQLQVLTVAGDAISHVTAFFDLSLFRTFGLPMSIPAELTTADAAGG